MILGNYVQWCVRCKGCGKGDYVLIMASYLIGLLKIDFYADTETTVN